MIKFRRENGKKPSGSGAFYCYRESGIMLNALDQADPENANHERDNTVAYTRI
jgi:hypothetical protein